MPASGLLSPVTRGDLNGWQGLPGDLPLDELTAVFPRDSDWAGSAQLGRLHREASFVWVDVPGAVGKMRVWFDGDRRVLLIDLDADGLRVPVSRLGPLLGEAPVALDTWRGTLPLPMSELVFAAHGLAAFAHRDKGTLWHLALFAPTTLEGYLDGLRLDLRVRRQPLAG